jgi:hypothetical protein
MFGESLEQVWYQINLKPHWSLDLLKPTIRLGDQRDTLRPQKWVSDQSQCAKISQKSEYFPLANAHSLFYMGLSPLRKCWETHFKVQNFSSPKGSVIEWSLTYLVFKCSKTIKWFVSWKWLRIVILCFDFWS